MPYWIEGYDATNKKAKIWVKVPRIPANGTTTLQMHYGNASASAMSNGTATFEFFDDFEDGTYADKWNADPLNPGTVTESEGMLKLDSVSAGGNHLAVAYSKQTFSKNIIIIMHFNVNPRYDGGYRSRINLLGSGTGSNSDFGGYFPNFVGVKFCGNPYYDGNLELEKRINGTTTDLDTLAEDSRGWDKTLELILATGKVEARFDGVLKLSSTDDSSLTTGKIALSTAGGTHAGSYLFLYDIRVRKYVPIEPTVTIENVSESWLTLSTDKKNYSLGENIVLGIVVNYTGNPVSVQFKLELQEPYGANPDTFLKTGFIPLTTGLYKKVNLTYPIPVSPLISEGEYTFKIYAIDGFGNIIASDKASIYINDSMPSSLVSKFI